MANLIPPLENGDRLNSIEFERRIATLPEQIKTKLIDGVVYMAAALRYEGHGLPHSHRHGVKEYIVWQVYEQKIDWFYLNEGRYVTLEANSSGLLESQVFPGLVLAVNALLAYDLAEVLAILQQHLNTDKHRAFLQTLAV